MTDLQKWTYRISGLVVSSEILLPGASQWDGGSSHPDIIVRRAPVEPKLFQAVRKGPAWETNGEQFLLNIESLGKFLMRSGGEILFDPDGNSDLGGIGLFVLGTCFTVLLQQRGYLILHASAVSVNSHAVLFCGPSGAGKSTMAALLGMRGYPLLNEDVCMLSPMDGGKYSLRSDSRMLKLWSETVAELDLNQNARTLVSEKHQKFFVEPLRSEIADKQSIKAIYVLSDLEKGNKPSLEHLNPLESAVELKRNAYRPTLVEAMEVHEDYFRISIGLLQHASVYRLYRPKDFGQTEALFALMEEHWKNLGLQISDRIETFS